MTEPNILGGLIGGATDWSCRSIAACTQRPYRRRLRDFGRADHLDLSRRTFLASCVYLRPDCGCGILCSCLRRLAAGTSSTRPDAVGCRFARRRGNPAGLRLHFGPRRLRSSAPFAAFAGGNYDFHGRRSAHRLLDASRILMAQIAAAFAVGVMFALGLAVSEMINPARVIGFLDVAGRWDPTLLLVMAGALAVTVPIFPSDSAPRQNHCLLRNLVCQLRRG